jgi:Protein of unknown function (DUF1453)
MSSTQTIITIVVIAAVLAFRVYRQTREQRWPIDKMWISPLIFLAITLVFVAIDTQQYWLAPAAGIVGLAAGVGVGLYQGNHTTLRLDKPNKAVFIKVNPIGSLIFIAILLLRFGLRFSEMSGMTQAQLSSGVLPVVSPAEVLLGSGLLALAAGSILGLRLYVKRRFDEAPEQQAA